VKDRVPSSETGEKAETALKLKTSSQIRFTTVLAHVSDEWISSDVAIATRISNAYSLTLRSYRRECRRLKSDTLSTPISTASPSITNELERLRSAASTMSGYRSSHGRCE
jgi:hypothetical protein